MTWLNWFVVCVGVAALCYAFRAEIIATVTKWFSRAEKAAEADIAKAEEKVKQEAELVIKKV